MPHPLCVAGTTISGGLLIPSLLTGAAGGRLVGQLLNQAMPNHVVNAGVYSFIGMLPTPCHATCLSHACCRACTCPLICLTLLHSAHSPVCAMYIMAAVWALCAMVAVLLCALCVGWLLC